MTRLLLAATLLGALPGVGVAATPGRAECPMSRLHACCKKARQKRDEPRLGRARLCCIVNCPQPAPTGTSFTFQPSNATANIPRPDAAGAPRAHTLAQARAYSPPFNPSHSPPAYLRHAAFLI